MGRERTWARRRLAVAVATLGLLIALLGGWTVWQILHQRDTARIAAAGLACLEARFLTEHAAPTEPSDLLADAVRQGQFAIYAEPLYAPGAPVGRQIAPQDRKPLSPKACTRERLALAKQSVRLSVFDGQLDGAPFAIASASGRDDSGILTYRLEVALPYEDRTAGLTRLALALAVATLALVGSIGAWWTITYMDGRLAQLTATLRAATGSDPAARAPSAGDATELGQLSAEINTALDRIGDQVVTLSVAGARAGHELLDPIERARTRLGVLSDMKLSRAAQAEVTGIDARLDRAAHAALSILDLTRSEPEPPTACDLSTLMADLIAGELEDTPGLDLSAEIDPGVWVMAHPDRMRVMALNLISNAHKHGLPGTIKFSLRATAPDGRHGFLLQLSNPASPGAAAARDLSGLFERHAETQARGHGMGLNTAHILALSEGFRVGKTPSRDSFAIWITGPALARSGGVDSNDPAR